MKSMILMAVLCFSAISFAETKVTPVASYQFGSVEGADSYVYLADLELDGLLRVYQEEGAGAFRTLKGERVLVAKIQLHPQVARNVFFMIESLSNEEVQVVQNQRVCRMMPSIAMSINDLSIQRQYDYNLPGFVGPMQLVHSAHGCWQSKSISFVEEYANTMALELKTILKTIVYQSL